MLFIFRKIRHSFFVPGKVRTYLAYVLGEIVLIVIGILVAVQIGNWNQHRLAVVEERYLLIELVDDLNQEAERLEFGIERQGQQMESFQGIRSFLKTRATSQE